jgi:hypothetical protein
MDQTAMREWLMADIRRYIGDGSGPFDNDAVRQFKRGVADAYCRVGKQFDILTKDDLAELNRIDAKARKAPLLS